ncbi:MAG: response regulator [Planctomycetia bacterium]|nr:response regulator [Planctomycetia bacterium]
MSHNCWDFMGCGKGPPSSGGSGACPAAQGEAGTGVNHGVAGGRICWAVTGTLCGGKVQGAFAQKELQCVACEFFKKVRSEECAEFRLLLPGQRVEDVLRESDLRYRRMFDGVPVGLYRTGAHGLFLDANLPLVNLLGYPDREALRTVGLKDLCLDPEELAGRAKALERDHVSLGRELRLRRFDGTEIRVRDSARAQVDESGRILSVEGSLEDVTSQRLVEDQLFQAQKMEVAGHVVGGVTHDFNNLLTAIMSAVHLLGPLTTPETGMQPVLDELGELAKRGSRLTQQLLSFVRKQEVRPQVLDLNAAVTDVQKMLRSLIGEDVELALALSPELGFVRADPGHVEQVLMNLAVNARDAMPRGGRVTIRTANQEVVGGTGIPAGPYVALSVSDTGCGMDAATLARIFEPFYTTKAPGKGTGLGLPTVRTIVQQSGGHIGVESAPGLGATFRILLPRVDVPAAAAAPPDAPLAAASGTETILLVEDEDVVRKSLSETLQSLGYTVLEARDGPEAIELLRGHMSKVQLLITDVVMPRMTGPELALQLERFGWTAPVLFISGYTDDAVSQAGLSAPVASFLQKPFTAGTLAARIREILSKRPIQV